MANPACFVIERSTRQPFCRLNVTFGAISVEHCLPVGQSRLHVLHPVHIDTGNWPAGRGRDMHFYQERLYSRSSIDRYRLNHCAALSGQVHSDVDRPVCARTQPPWLSRQLRYRATTGGMNAVYRNHFCGNVGQIKCERRNAVSDFGMVLLELSIPRQKGRRLRGWSWRHRGGGCGNRRREGRRGGDRGCRRRAHDTGRRPGRSEKSGRQQGARWPVLRWESLELVCPTPGAGAGGTGGCATTDSALNSAKAPIVSLRVVIRLTANYSNYNRISQ